VKKGKSRLSGLDEKIVALYARGISVRDIQAQLQEMYGVSSDAKEKLILLPSEATAISA
jgi:transposase-like protein